MPSVPVGSTDRIDELSTTSVPTPFELVYEQPVSDWRGAEELAHRKLSGSRDRARREFFRIGENRAIDVIKEVALEFPSAARGDGGGTEVCTVGPLSHARIVECNHAGLEVAWETPTWFTADDRCNYSKTPEVHFLFAAEPPVPRVIARVWCVEHDGDRWALCSGDRFTPNNDEARDAPLKVSIYRKLDRARERLERRTG